MLEVLQLLGIVDAAGVEQMLILRYPLAHQLDISIGPALLTPKIEQRRVRNSDLVVEGSHLHVET